MSQNREQDILNFIKDFHAKNQWAPSIREIADGVGLYSSSTVQGYLERMAKKGKIVYNGVRQIRVVGT
ncbi:MULTISPECIES: hypothetical protein [unclassified Dehalobacter]|uniref:LexA family protein n=1 Tax=unclassified Dehalobacter TaxID=2635733 RepID=UPI00104E1EC2|nr:MULTISPECIES: hypothetical protein [unclassified Dehalobacter]TCX51957.1 hypothetical protein C1I36_06465 [Dehalobacter sp. 14DCB1]TCX53017.1 hypothetical protein C1I38_08145 [Dehalobacter sp. 12DCB1]